LREKCEETA
jgi:hypothetical protein